MNLPQLLFEARTNQKLNSLISSVQGPVNIRLPHCSVFSHLSSNWFFYSVKKGCTLKKKQINSSFNKFINVSDNQSEAEDNKNEDEEVLLSLDGEQQIQTKIDLSIKKALAKLNQKQSTSNKLAHNQANLLVTDHHTIILQIKKTNLQNWFKQKLSKEIFYSNQSFSEEHLLKPNSFCVIRFGERQMTKNIFAVKYRKDFVVFENKLQLSDKSDKLVKGKVVIELNSHMKKIISSQCDKIAWILKSYCHMKIVESLCSQNADEMQVDRVELDSYTIWLTKNQINNQVYAITLTDILVNITLQKTHEKELKSSFTLNLFTQVRFHNFKQISSFSHTNQNHIDETIESNLDFQLKLKHINIPKDNAHFYQNRKKLMTLKCKKINHRLMAFSTSEDKSRNFISDNNTRIRRTVVKQRSCESCNSFLQEIEGVKYVSRMHVPEIQYLIHMKMIKNIELANKYDSAFICNKCYSIYIQYIANKSNQNVRNFIQKQSNETYLNNFNKQRSKTLSNTNFIQSLSRFPTSRSLKKPQIRFFSKYVNTPLIESKIKSKLMRTSSNTTVTISNCGQKQNLQNQNQAECFEIRQEINETSQRNSQIIIERPIILSRGSQKSYHQCYSSEIKVISDKEKLLIAVNEYERKHHLKQK